jgi:cytochrome c-type biogenesis protein CcmH/NrfG
LGDLDNAMRAYAQAYRLRPQTVGTIAMALTSAPHGRLWLDEAALRRALGGQERDDFSSNRHPALSF